MNKLTFKKAYSISYFLFLFYSYQERILVLILVLILTTKNLVICDNTHNTLHFYKTTLPSSSIDVYRCIL